MKIIYTNYTNGYVKVSELMKKELPKPRQKKMIINYGEKLPIFSFGDSL